jgi:dihydrofolate reductase
MRKLVVSAWVTLDGVFDADLMEKWFFPYDSPERQNYIRDGILACGAILIGRTTYEMLASYWAPQKNNEQGVAAKLNSVEKFVVSTKLKKADWNNSTIINENVIEEVKRLKQQPGNEIQIEGSATLVQSLMEAGVIDEFRLLVHPVVMGSGKRFFKEGVTINTFKLIKAQTLEKGVMLLCYQK